MVNVLERTNVDKVLKVCEQYNMRMIREIRIFLIIMEYNGEEPLSREVIRKQTGYTYGGIKKVVYKLGIGKECGYEGHKLIKSLDTSRTRNREKEIVLTRRGAQLAARLRKLC